MTRRIIISKNPLEPESYEIHENVVDVPGFLMTQFPTWPDGGRIYHERVAQDHDVTPSDEASIERLNELDGDIYVVVYPEGFVALILLVVVAVVALVAVAMLTKPAIPDASSRNQQAGSPNNELAARTNRPRLNGRIPEIYGIVRSTPDMIMPEYKYYEGNRKVEVAYMCVGRGSFTIYDVRDADTLIAYITSASAAFYGPNTSPNSGHAPQYSVGAPIGEPLYRPRKLEQVVGQELRPPNAASYSNRPDFKFQYPDRLYNSTGVNFQDKFLPDDQVYISGATYSGVIEPVTQTAIARYVWNGGSPYIEWQSGNPTTFFQNGDLLAVSNSSTTATKKPFTTSWTGRARFRDNGRIYFDENPGDDQPVEDGFDFRTSKDFVLTNASYTYNLQGTYTITAKTSTKLTLQTPSAVNSEWDKIKTATGYQTVTVEGISRSVRFTSAGEIELQSGNWNDIDFPTDTSVLVGTANFTTNLNGTYQATSFSSSQDYWALDNPSGSNAEWNEINNYSPWMTVTIQQTHSTDTTSTTFDGIYSITAMTSSRIYISPAPGGPGIALLSGFVNERTEYGSSDTFQVLAPFRSVNLNGYYTIVGVGLYEMFFGNPTATSGDWNLLQFYSGDQIQPANCSIATTGGNWIGPFFMDEPSMTNIYSSFQAPNGMYKDDGKDQTRAQVEVQMLIYPATSAGGGNGTAPLDIRRTLTGSAVQRDTIGATRKIGLGVGYTGYNLIYCRRLTAKDTAFEGQVVDTVKWEEVYMLSPEPLTQFGDVTTVHSKTYATGGALALKERKLNCLVGRKIPVISGFTGTYPNMTPVYAPDPAVSTDAAQIFCALSLDPKFGNRTADELDFYNIFTARNAVQAYFNSANATLFSYTFDQTNISYEEAANAISQAAFCVAYRQGNVIKWKPEISTNDSVLIFNHRNKIPDTETRTVRFGAQNDHDSIQLEWVNPEDDAVETYFIPEDQSGSAPKKIETVGIRNIAQATWHAWRSYYKTLYQNVLCEFESTQEAALLIQRDRVMVADNTRADTQDGEVWDQDVLQLTLSQEVNFDPALTYTIFLQHVDGTVEAIPCTSVPDDLVNLTRNTYFHPDGYFRWPIAADAGKLSAGDTVTIGNTSMTLPEIGTFNLNGTYTVIGVDGISGKVYLDQPWLINASWANKLPAGVETLKNFCGFDATKNSRRKINLQYAPRLALNLDPEGYSRATYVIRGNDEVAPQAFMVQETRPKDNFTYQVSLANYDPRFYYMDDLQFWLNFDDQTFKDASAQAHNVSRTGSAGQAQIAYNNVRKSYCFYNATNATAARVNSSNLAGTTTQSYTKAFWIQQGAGFDSFFLSNAYQQFRVNNSGRIIAGHDAASPGGVTTLTVNAWPSSDGQWHHAACVYDYPNRTLKVYVDGVKVGQRVNVNPPSQAGILQPIGLNSSGVAHPWCDDVRYWRRAFTDGEITELYNSTR